MSGILASLSAHTDELDFQLKTRGPSVVPFAHTQTDEPNATSQLSVVESLGGEKLSQLDLSDAEGEEETTESSGSDEDVDGLFDPAKCLFCNQRSADLGENMGHMQKRHGLFIPSPDSLIVDLETLVGYLHLVIVEYAECLYCGSARKSSQAAQQHMTGKGHCRVDITKEGSEFRGFYDLDPSSGTDSDEDTGKTSNNTRGGRFVDLDEKTRRLASGKVLSHRNGKKPRAHRRLLVDEPKGDGSLLEERKSSGQDASKALALSGNGRRERAAAEKRDLLFHKQLATLRSGDRQVLEHLPLFQQRALVAKAKKQQGKWNRDQMAQEIKRQLKANP